MSLDAADKVCDVMPSFTETKMPEIPELSFVIPCYNEEGNLLALITAVREAVEPLKRPYEVVITDDCSRDRTWELLKHLAAGDPRIRAQRFAFNCGQSAALWAGMQAARGRVIVTLDADLQNDPRDLPKLLAALEKFDCACGSRVAARRAERRIHQGRVVADRQRGPQRVVRRKHQRRGLLLPGVQTRVHREPEIFQGHAPLHADPVQDRRFHRHRDPDYGQPPPCRRSHYGIWNRLFASFYDLLAVRWMKKRMFRYQIAERIN